MPIYEYKCKNCGNEFEIIKFLAKKPVEKYKICCPKCKTTNLIKLISFGTIRPNGIPTGKGGFNLPSCKKKQY